MKKRKKKKIINIISRRFQLLKNEIRTERGPTEKKNISYYYLD